MFKNSKMSVLSYADGITIWSYNDNLDLDAILADGFFNPVYTIANTNDIVYIGSKDGAAQRYMEIKDRIIYLRKMK